MSLVYRPKHIGAKTPQETILGEESKSKDTKFRIKQPLFWLFSILFFLFFFGSIIYFWIYSQSELVVARVLDDEGELNHIVDQFARTITRQDWQGNVDLFVTGSTIDFHRAFTFLTDNPPFSLNNNLDVAVLPVGSWGQQLSVFAGGLSSNHLLIGNCNISFSKTSSQTASLDCIAIYSYTLAYSMSLYTNNYPTQFVVFQPSFTALKTANKGWQFTYASALINATSTLLSSVETGVSPPGAIITRKRIGDSKRFNHVRDPSVVWTTLQYQIDTLIAQGQIDTAKAVCRTEQYITLAATFDPYGNNTAFQCNTIMRIPVTLNSILTCDANGGINASSCFPDGMGGIETINSIGPYPITDDFTITGGFGISIQGGINGIIIHNVGLVSMMFDSSPELILTVTALPIPTLHITNAPQPPNTVWAGPLSGLPFAPAFRLLTLADIPLIDLSSHVTNVLGLINGGTNNGGPYVGDRIIVSNTGGTRLEEASALSDGYFLVGGPGGSLIPGSIAAGDGINVTFGGGIFTITSMDAITVVQVDLSVPTDIFQVTSIPVIENGTLTFVVIPQAAHSIWMGPNGGGPMVPSFRVLQEVDLPVISLTGTKLSGILPVTRGGTNNDGSTWVGERLIMTNTGGTSLTEGTISGINGVSITLGPGPSLIVSGTGGTCGANETIDQTCLDISNLSCPSGSLSTTCIPSTLTLAALTVTGPTSLGTSTTCASPLSAPCYDISSQSCPGGYLNANCINPDLTLNSLHINSIVVNDITLLNGTITVEGMSDFESVNTTTLYVQSIQLSGPMMCSPEDTISHDCYDISGISCTAPISSNCFPINITLADLSVTNNLEVVNVACLGPQLGDDCIPSRVRTINGISPSLAPALDFTVLAGTGVSITNIANGISIANTGVTSVGLSLPSSIMSVTISSVTTTGTLTAVLQPQAEKTFWAGPISGSNADPTFRLIEFTDLPVTGIDSLYYVDSAGNLTTAPLSLSLVVPTGEFSIVGSPITNPTGTFTISKQIQVPHSFWAGPSSGITSLVPTFRTMVFGDLTSLGLTNGQILTGVTGGAPVGKTLVAGTNMIITEMGGSFVFDASNVDAISNLTITVPSYLSVNPATLFASGTFDITANDQNANQFLAGPTSGGPAPTAFRSMVNADLPPLTDGMLYIGQTGGPPVSSQLTAGTLITVTPGPGTSTISSSALGLVTLNMPTAIYDVAVSSGPNSETLTVTFDNQAANTVWSGPSSGLPAVPTFRALVAADIPSLDTSKITSGILPIARGGTNSGTTLNNNRIMISSGGAIVERAAMTNGQILIGSTGLAPVAATLTGTTNRVTVTNGAGTITLSGPQDIHTAATPTFASQTLSATTNQLRLGTTNTATISATAPAASRTYTIADPGANANFVMDTAGPLVITSTPLVGQVLTATSGTTANWATPISGGTVTSVGLSLPASVFSISGSPVIGSGTLTGSFNTQTANTFFAGPSSGGAAVPTFRAITTADLPPAVLLTYVEQTNSTAEPGFNSPTYTTVPGMSVSPVAGTYWCSFSTTVFPSSGSAMFNLGLFKNGVIINHSRRIIGGAGSNFNIHTLAVGVVSTGDTIDVRWQRTSVSGSATVYERSLYCLRIF